jgi:hypothetical protein
LLLYVCEQNPRRSSALQTFSRILSWCQRSLFPELEDEFGPLCERHRKLINILVLVRIEEALECRRSGRRGRPELDRCAIARAFIAKSVLNLPDTRALISYLQSSPTIRKICGWSRAGEIPSESTFCRAFAEFADTQLPARLHEVVIEHAFEGRVVGHVSRDSTDIHAREKPKPKHRKKEIKAPRKRGRPKKGEVRPPKEPTRLQRQQTMTLEHMLADLPAACDVGSKTNSKGKKNMWIGYKLHVDYSDSGIPISCLLTSASLHDSQAALPLSLISNQRVDSLYDVMDAAYDMPVIHDHCAELGHVAIIDHNPRRSGVKRQMDPAKTQRYKIRSSAERGFSRLKDSFGARLVRVRGHTKVFTHLMFGLLALTVDQLASTIA